MTASKKVNAGMRLHKAVDRVGEVNSIPTYVNNLNKILQDSKTITYKINQQYYSCI